MSFRWLMYEIERFKLPIFLLGAVKVQFFTVYISASTQCVLLHSNPCGKCRVHLRGYYCLHDRRKQSKILNLKNHPNEQNIYVQ